MQISPIMLFNQPKYIPEMIQKMKNDKLDVVYGSRYVPRGGICGWDFFRKMTSRVANYLTVQMLDVFVSDFTGSFRIYKRTVFEELIKEVKNKGYAFQMEIIVRACWKKHKVGEVPIVFVDRMYGSSKLGPNEIYIYLKSLWTLFNTER